MGAEETLRAIEAEIREKAGADSAARPGFRRGLLAAADILKHRTESMEETWKS